MGPPPSVEHSASSPILQGDQLGDRAPAPMNPNFSIRDFTLAVRKRDIRKTYPFMSAVESAERKGKLVRLLLPNISPRMKREELSDTEEEREGDRVKSEEQVVRKDPQQEVQPRGNRGGEDQQEGLALLGRVAEGEGSGQVEDKASDTGVTTEAETEEQQVGAGTVKEGEEQQQAEQQAPQGPQQQQQNVCPVCGSFSSHSVTALNAHMDSCLASPSMAKSHKSRSKHVKMRSITDIMSPRQSDSGSQKSTLRDKPEKERRTSLHVHSDNLNNNNNNNLTLSINNNNNNNNNNSEQDCVAKEVKDVSSGGQQPHHHRQLRSRSRGSTSVPVPPKLDLPSAAGGERWGSRRRSGAPRSGGECSEPLKKKLCSGNSADPTNSWTHSISSGGTTDCLSKTQDVVEKSCASTNSQTLPVQEGDADQSSKEAENGGEKSTGTALVQVSEGGTAHVPAPTADNLTSVPAGVALPSETELQVDLENKEAVPVGDAAETCGVDSTSQREKATADGAAENTSAPEAGASVEAIPVVDVSRLVVPSLPPSAAACTVQQNAPVYESIISSLRSPAVGSLASTVPSTSTPWKAAVVMASLGAVEVKSGRPDNVPATSARPSVAGASSSAPVASPSLAPTPPPVQAVNPKAPLFRGPGTDIYQLPSQQPAFPSTRAYPSPVSTPDRPRLVQRPPQVVRMQNSSDRMVIDVDQESLRSGPGAGRVERPVIRLLGQNVTVDSTSIHRDAQGNRNPYGFSVPGPGYHTPCCCRSRHVHEPLAWKNISGVACSNVNLANSSQIPVQGSWRLLPNGTLTQFGNAQVTLQPGVGPRMGMNSLGGSQRRPPLPPWLLEAKKQQDAANVIVIDDDDEEESKVIPRAPGSSSGMPPSSRPSGCSQKREGDNLNVQRAEKVQKVAETDSTGSRMVLVPSLVPAWTIATNCNNDGASTSNGAGSRRGATAQEYKARIAMMNINTQQPHGSEQLPGTVNGASTSTSGSQPRGLVSNTAPPGYVYQFPAQHAARVFQLQGDGTAAPAPTIFAHPGFVTPTALQQQPLVFGRDCQIIQLEGQYLIVNTGVPEQQVLSPQGDILGRSLILCNNTGNNGASASNSTNTNTSTNTTTNTNTNTNSNIAATTTTSNNNNNNNVSDSRRGGMASGPEPILVTPVIQQHQGNGYVFAAPDQHVHHHPVIPVSVQQLQQLQLQQHQQLSILQSHSGTRDTKGGGSRNSYGVGPGKNGL